ncbi:MAG: hypothetical protein QM743_02265 [Chitinophagaceae bacterium]
MARLLTHIVIKSDTMRLSYYITLLLATVFSCLVLSCSKNAKVPAIRFRESADADENVRQVLSRASGIEEYTLNDMRAYSASTQILIFQHLSPASKLRLVQERLTDAIDREADPTKKDVIAGLLRLVTPAVYGPGGDSSAMASIDGYVESAIPLLGYDYVKTLVTTWGGNNESSAFVFSGQTGGRATGGTFGGDGPIICNCSRESDWIFPALPVFRSSAVNRPVAVRFGGTSVMGCVILTGNSLMMKFQKQIIAIVFVLLISATGCVPSSSNVS